MVVLPKLICRFSAISVKFPTVYFVDINKLILKFTRGGKRPGMANKIMKEKNKVGGFTVLKLQVIVKIVQNW